FNKWKFSGTVNTGYQLGTGYTLVPNTVTNTSPGQMIIATSTGSLNNNFLNFTDHTGGGNMLVVDGGNAQQNILVCRNW
ncbi:MAG: hypothetical protein HC854_14010, partial [Flavobacterium sp.]|nr:hypothetical protein [Flavobacterium sp.]